MHIFRERVAVALVMTLLAACAAPETAEVAQASHTRCAWIGQDTYASGVATYVEHADFFDAIHPKWHELTEAARIRTFANAGDARVRDTAAAAGALLMPMIADRKVEGLRLMMNDPARR